MKFNLINLTIVGFSIFASFIVITYLVLEIIEFLFM